jgi:outer membrane immunogenic protein
MRRVLFAAISLLGLAATSAAAADLPRALPPVKAPVAYIPAVYSWNGFYLGINGGGGWGHSHWNNGIGSTDVSGGLAGVTAGYNWQTGPWVFGLEGDIDWSNIKGNFSNTACPLGCETKNDWLGTARGRLGWAFDRWMPYITGGAAFGNVKATQAGIASASDTNVGWTIGGGIEAALFANWTAKLEYLYADLGHVDCGACLPAASASFKTNIVRAGLNYRF